MPVDGKLQSCVFLDTPGHEVDPFSCKLNLHMFISDAEFFIDHTSLAFFHVACFLTISHLLLGLSDF